MMQEIAIMSNMMSANAGHVATTEDGPPTMLTPDYHRYKMIPPERYEKENIWDRDMKFVVFRHDMPSFQIWHECWKNEKRPMDKRFYFNYPSLIRGYNDFAMNKRVSMPEGFSSVLSFKGRSGWWDEEGWWRHYRGVKGITLKRPTSCTKIDDSLREEERLNKKFSWFDHGLDFKGLQELDEWYENLRTWEDDRYS